MFVTGAGSSDLSAERGPSGKRRPVSPSISASLEGGSLEARAGIEPAHKGFADLSLTTWVPRLGRAAFKIIVDLLRNRRSQPGNCRRTVWSGRRDLNSRPSPWQGDALPLSYSRLSQV